MSESKRRNKKEGARPRLRAIANQMYPFIAT